MGMEIPEEATRLLFENISKHLQAQFGHSPSHADALIRAFRDVHEHRPGTEGGWTFLEWIHHDDAPAIALYIQYHFAVAKPDAKHMDYLNWKRDLQRAEDEKWRRHLETRKQQQ